MSIPVVVSRFDKMALLFNGAVREVEMSFDSRNLQHANTVKQTFSDTCSRVMVLLMAAVTETARWVRLQHLQHSKVGGTTAKP
jgi:hypothetical protein